MLIAVDFDGTIVEHKYPAIGVKASCWKKPLNSAGNVGWNFMPSIETIPKRKKGKTTITRGS